MITGAAYRAAEAIRSDPTLAASIVQRFTPAFLSTVAAASTQLLKFAAELAPVCSAVLGQLTEVAERLEPVLSESRAAEYEKYLIEIGYDPAQARFLGNLAITLGGPLSKDVTECRRSFGGAMREIAQANGALAISCRAALLLPELHQWGKVWIENGLREARHPLSYDEFHALVEQATGKGCAACKFTRRQ